MDKLQKIANIGKSTKEKQSVISVVEVFYVWDILVTKLDIMEAVQIFQNMIEDDDLKFVNRQVANTLSSGIMDMERIMRDYDLPFPPRPPAAVNSTVRLENITDRDIFQMLYEAIQAFFPILGIGFMQSTTPDVRKAIKEHLLITIEMQEILVEYGKLKNFLYMPPVYRP